MGARLCRGMWRSTIVSPYGQVFGLIQTAFWVLALDHAARPLTPLNRYRGQLAQQCIPNLRQRLESAHRQPMRHANDVMAKSPLLEIRRHQAQRRRASREPDPGVGRQLRCRHTGQLVQRVLFTGKHIVILETNESEPSKTRC